MRRPHPATVIATIALAGAWGGPAVARSLISGGDVRDESLTGRDIRNSSLTGADIKANSISGGDVTRLTGRDFRHNSIDGWAIFEEGLDTVPEAEHAERAGTADRAAVATRAEQVGDAASVGGSRIVRFRFVRAADGQNVEVLRLGGLVLSARCSAPAALTVTAATDSDGAAIHSGFTRGANNGAQPGFRADDDFRRSESFDPLGSSATDLQGTLTYLAKGGAVVSATYLAQAGDNGPLGATGCLFAGTAVGG